MAPEWVREFGRQLPDEVVQVWPDVGDRDAVEFVICWNFDVHQLATFPNLRGVLVAGAGVDHLQPLDVIPDVPIVRLVDPAVASDIANYCVHWIVHFHRSLDRYQMQQPARTWDRHPYRSAAETTVGIAGIGSIGRVIANRAASAGYRTIGWSRNKSQIDGVETFAGEDLPAFLSLCDMVVNVLPSTPETHELFDATTLAAMKDTAVLINVGRGETIDESALRAALDAGTLHHAVLDVQQHEPLPNDSPLWSQKRLTLTPHISGFTFPATAVGLMAANIARIRNGEDPFPTVDRTVGY